MMLNAYLVSILILMDLPFLLDGNAEWNGDITSFNPYSNGSSFFIVTLDPFTTFVTSFQSLF